MTRPVGVIHDPDAEKRSLMLRRKVLCNGEATGIRCEHYWTMVRNEPSQNPDFLVMGGKLRFCRAWGKEPLEFGEGHSELCTLGVGEPTHRGCERYRASGATSDGDGLAGLVTITRRQKKQADGSWTDLETVYEVAPHVAERHRFDATFEKPSVDDTFDKVQKAFEEVPLRPELKDGAIVKGHEDAFGPMSLDAALNEVAPTPPPVSVPRTAEKKVSRPSKAAKKKGKKR